MLTMISCWERTRWSDMLAIFNMIKPCKALHWNEPDGEIYESQPGGRPPPRDSARPEQHWGGDADGAEEEEEDGGDEADGAAEAENDGKGKIGLPKGCSKTSFKIC